RSSHPPTTSTYPAPRSTSSTTSPAATTCSGGPPPTPTRAGRARPHPADHLRGRELAPPTARDTRGGCELHVHWLPQTQAHRWPRLTHPRAVDQRRHRTRRPAEQGGAEAGLVLGRQSSHVARVRLRLG